MPRKERDEKRRDNKGRLLKSGESQRSDGRYAYKYIDTFGEPQFVYSWKLVPTDKVPAGKRPCLSLREKIKQIQKDLDDGIDTIGKKMTVCQLYEKYTRQRGNVRKGTQKSRQQLMKLLSEDKLGAASIDSVKLSDAKEWALRMQEKGVAYNTICNSKRSLKAIFYMAVQDDCLRKNPFDFQINEVINDDTVPKVPLTPTQENELLDFMQNDPVYVKYYDEVVILLETGLRISELCGLTPADLNFEKRFVNVDHQLLRSTEDGYYIEAPKTESGFRQVPMSAAAYEAFERVLKKRRDGKCIEVDGYKDFLFLNRDGLPKTAVNYDAMFKCLAKKYNKCHKEPLPDVMTPHTMRHTFCTRMANAGMNPKALQYIMGHANIVMTLNYYAHATFHSAQEEMERLQAKAKTTTDAKPEPAAESAEETNGINPIDGTMAPDDDLINNVRLSRCFFFVSDVLRQVIENGGTKSAVNEKLKKLPLEIPMEKRSQFAYSEVPIPASEIAKRINALADNDTMQKLTYSGILTWLTEIGMMECALTPDGKRTKRPTKIGEETGISVEERTSSNGPYQVVVYNNAAQHFIIDNLDAILTAENMQTEMQGAPWTKDHDDCLIDLYKKSVPVSEMAITLKRSTSAVRGRLKKLGFDA